MLKFFERSVYRRVQPSDYSVAILIRLQSFLGGLRLPFDKRIKESSTRYTAVSVHKIFGICARMIADSTNKK